MPFLITITTLCAFYCLTVLLMVIKPFRKKGRKKKPVRQKLSPYKIGSHCTLYKEEFNSKFIINIDSEFCRGK